MNWKPAPSFDLALFVAIPLAVYFLKEFIPGSDGVNNAAMLFLGIVSFYSILILRYGLISNAIGIFGSLFWGMSFSVLCGMLVYQLFHMVYSS